MAEQFKQGSTDDFLGRFKLPGERHSTQTRAPYYFANVSGPVINLGADSSISLGEVLAELGYRQPRGEKP